MRTPTRIIVEIARAVRYELLSTFGTLFTVFLAMSLPGALWIVTDNLARSEREFKAGLSMEVFLAAEPSPEKMMELKSYFVSLPGIMEVRYLSSQEALFKMRQMFGLDMVKDLEENPLPASFELVVDESLYEPGAADKLKDQIEKLPEVEDVVFASEMLTRLQQVIRTIKILWLAISILVAFSAVFIVANIVRVAVNDRKKTVEIMQLVGATRNYIMAPFILLGGILGFLGAGLAALFLWFSTSYVSSHLIKVVFPGIYDVAAFLLIGLLLGMFGALVATEKYLKI